MRGRFLEQSLLLGWSFLRGWFRSSGFSSRFDCGFCGWFRSSGFGGRLRGWFRSGLGSRFRSRLRGWFGSGFLGDWLGSGFRSWFGGRLCDWFDSSFCGWFRGRFCGWFNSGFCSGLRSGFRGWLGGRCSFLSGFFCHVVTPPFRRNSTHTHPAVLGVSQRLTSPLESHGRNGVWHSPIGQALKKA